MKVKTNVKVGFHPEPKRAVGANNPHTRLPAHRPNLPRFRISVVSNRINLEGCDVKRGTGSEL